MNHNMIQHLTTMVALIISLVSAYFAWAQLEISRIHNRLSVEPIVHITPYAEGKQGRNGLYLSNAGLGSAILTSMSAQAAGVSAKGFDTDQWSDILTAAGADAACFATAWPRGESALKAGDEIPLFYVTKADGAERCYLEMIRLMGGPGIEVTVGYQSIYKNPKTASASTRVRSKTIDALYQKLSGH